MRIYILIVSETLGDELLDAECKTPQEAIDVLRKFDANNAQKSIGLEPCAICGSTGFHRPSCSLYSYPCAICGARISNTNALDHVHKPLPLYVGKPDDYVTTLDSEGK